MAPPMKELPRWLLDNPEFSVAPDWTDIVKQSVSWLEIIKNKEKNVNASGCCVYKRYQKTWFERTRYQRTCFKGPSSIWGQKC